jgi:RNA polymerase sigma-70 factor, ECF subfamily
MDPQLVTHLRSAQAGDADAFAYVATAFRADTLRWSQGLLRDRAAAEDVVQEALVIALQGLGALRDLEAFPGWLAQVVRTAAARHTRRRRPDLLDSPALEHALGQDPDPDADPAARAAAAETRALVRAAVRDLPPSSQDVIDRYYLEGSSVAETAAALGLPPGTVKRRLHEARGDLRGRLSGLAPPRRPARTPSRTRLRYPL